ncbi:MAG: asparagine synthase (glutamine-hydrolyzing) [Clostridiales bacterium]|jgi:asparagine synthase (glutamine-hydrolysing)|nr:asparagine synthase (glutamine-hydrolyzing) [Clostridiales bacterium]
MCGFVGFTGETENAEDIITRMMKRIAHRGPDSAGVYLGGLVSLGFRRLSIIGLDDGAQPMFNEDRTLVVVFNGEIYNYQTLKDELEGLGHTFSSHADTETLLHLYEEYGVEMLNRLRGMFAFAIYDIPNNKLFCSRDFFGIKPFYYADVNGNLMFGSEIKSFLEHPDFKKELNEEALENYLTFQYSVLPETFFKGVYKLPPGHYLLYEGGEAYIKQYWQSRFEPEDMDLASAVAMLETTLQESVDKHKQVSDVEVGSFLSSGVDSSYVAAAFHGDKTFTVGFDYDNYNEIEYAKTLSAKVGIENYSKTISTDEYWEHLPKVQYHMDEPLADASAIALYFVSQTASKYVKVALSGEGADEFFGGYNIYKEPLDIKPLTSLPKPVRRFLGALASAIPFDIKGKNLLIRASKDIEERFIGNARIFDKTEREKILRRPKGRYNPGKLTEPYYRQCVDKNGCPQDDITKMQTLDIHLWMVGDILLKADKMSMAHSLEVRVPFLDKEVFSAASKLPTELRCNKLQTKYAFRQATLKKLPQEVADKKKLGFPVPIRIWLKEEKYYERVKKYFVSRAAEKYFNVSAILKLLDEHKRGRRDNSRKIWTVFMFLMWHEQFFPEEL